MIEPYKPKLQVGSVIRVVGWVMLEGLEEGEYKVAGVENHYGSACYRFTRKRGKRVVAVHFASTVDGWIRPENGNRIEIVG